MTAGRKPIHDTPMVTRAFVITREQAEWLDQYDNKSEVVRAALAAWKIHMKELGLIEMEHEL